MTRRKQAWPNDKVEEIDWWDKEIDGTVLRFVINQVTKQKPGTGQRRIHYAVTVRRADDQYHNLGNAFDDQPGREKAEACFPKEELTMNFGT